MVTGQLSLSMIPGSQVGDMRYFNKRKIRNTLNKKKEKKRLVVLPS